MDERILKTTLSVARLYSGLGLSVTKDSLFMNDLELSGDDFDDTLEMIVSSLDLTMPEEFYLTAYNKIYNEGEAIFSGALRLLMPLRWFSKPKSDMSVYELAKLIEKFS